MKKILLAVQSVLLGLGGAMVIAAFLLRLNDRDLESSLIMGLLGVGAMALSRLFR